MAELFEADAQCGSGRACRAVAAVLADRASGARGWCELGRGLRVFRCDGRLSGLGGRGAEETGSVEGYDTVQLTQ